MDVHETIKDIKGQFRLFMNGVVSQSMREKGLDYKLNFWHRTSAFERNKLLVMKKIMKWRKLYGKKISVNVKFWRECYSR